MFLHHFERWLQRGNFCSFWIPYGQQFVQGTWKQNRRNTTSVTQIQALKQAYKMMKPFVISPAAHFRVAF